MTINTTWGVFSVPSSQQDQVLSNEKLEAANRVIIVFRFIVAGLAIPLTLCNIIVFLHRNMRSATAVYVIGLSAGQLVYVISANVPQICLLTFSDPLNDWLYMMLFMYVGVYCSIVARRGAYVVMGLVSLERLYAIVRPLHVKGFVLSRYPLVCLVSTYIATAILHTYIPTKTAIRSIPNYGPQNITIFRPVPTSLYVKHKAINDAFSLMAKVLLTYCGLIIQIILNFLTIFFLQRHNTQTQTMKKTTAKEDVVRQRERQLTVTILAATLSYVALSLPLALHHLVYTIHPEYNGLGGPYRNVYFLVRDVTFLLSVLSCCVDFVCFMVLSSNYRATFVSVCGLRRKGTREAEMPGLSTQLQTVG